MMKRGGAGVVVAYHCSESYAEVAGVSMASLFESSKGFPEITVYLIENRLSELSKARLSSIAAKYGRELAFVEMPDYSRLLGLRQVKRKWLGDSYCRLFLDTLLPQDVERVLYLDSDTLVAGSLSELWSTDMKGKCLGGSLDCLGKPYFRLFGIDEGGMYLNSGVLLINLKLWRERRAGERVRDYVQRRGGYLFFMEQSAMNAALQDELFDLGARFNVSTLMLSMPYDELCVARGPARFYSRSEYAEAVKNPVIIHMTSAYCVARRPWIDGSRHPARKCYLRYRACTPWGSVVLAPDARSVYQRIKDVIIWIIPQLFTLLTVRIAYNHVRIFFIRLGMVFNKQRKLIVKP
jgi:lipopolysaccharide biosynthesis glycosyltransferase